MKMKRIKYIAALVFISVIGVVVFQVFWILKTYQINEQHFEKDVQEALNLAIRDDIIKDIHPKYTFSHPDTLTGCVSDSSDEKINLLEFAKNNNLNIKIKVNNKKADSSVEKTETGSSVEETESDSGIVTTKVPPERVQDSLKSLMGDAFVKVLSAVYGERININSVDSFFRKRLLEKGIDNQYNIAVFENGNLIKIKDSANTVFNDTLAYAPLGETRIIKAKVNHKTISVLKNMWLTIFGSFFLVSLVLISFFYMLHIILRQKKLSDLKNEFISNLTHEFKTPIATVTAAVEAMKSFGASEDKNRREKYLSISLKQLHHLNSMVENALNISASEKSADELNIEVFNLSELVAEAIDRFKIVHKGDLSVNENYSDEVWVKADRSQMNNVVNNLIDNAIKYSKGKAELKVSCVINKAKAELRIIDKGIGISEENQTHIFERFYRAPSVSFNDVRGFGLGLSYVKDVIEKHQGVITLKSRKNEGSEFIILLPLADGTY